MDRIRLNYKKYRLTGVSQQWKAYRKQAIQDIKELWQKNHKYYEPFSDDYYQLYDSWDQNDIYYGYCKFVLDAGDENFTICHVNEPNSAFGIFIDDFDELISYWREKLNDPSISISMITD